MPLALVALAEQSMFRQLRSIPAPWFVGPIFTASQWMSADADLIAGRTLIEVKTNLGGLKSGVRSPDLSVGTLRQLVGYVLHDIDDIYGLDHVGIYEARYGALTIWPIQQLLNQLAGQQVELQVLRAHHAQLLTTSAAERTK